MVTDPPPLGADELAAYFALMEVSSVLHHAVEQQLRADGGLTRVQFQILARLDDAPTSEHRMTDLADLVVYSRSGLTYQAQALEKRGLLARRVDPDDERAMLARITPAGSALIAEVLPGHVEVVRRLFLDAVPRRDLAVLTRVLARVREEMRAGPPRSAARRRAA